MKNKMIAWVAGVILLVVFLMAVIVSMEPARPGLSRAQAFKALALAFTTKEECEKREEQRTSSWFSAREQKNWFVKYMDYLYEEGFLDPELTKPALETAQGRLTYGEASFLAERVSKKLKSQVGMTKKNRSSDFPEEDWWKLYSAILENQGESCGVRQVEAVLYGTPSNLEQAASWTAYTTEGNFGFEGLALDSYLDCRLRFYVRDGEMAAVTELMSQEASYENVWLSQADDKSFRVYLGSTYRDFPMSEAGEAAASVKELAPNLVDLHMKEGRLTAVDLKSDRINGKVLSVSGDSIEIEGYGKLPLSPQFKVYKIYGDFQILDAGDILVGYDLQEFVAAEGKLCAALLEREFDAKTIRVLLMDTGFSSIFHNSVEIALKSGADLEYENARGRMEKERLEAGDVLTMELSDKRLQYGRAVLTPDEPDSMEIRSIERSQGNPVYSGRLELRAEEQGITLVNELYLEDYLVKVVPSEMPPSYETEALKAQAVCARTYAFRQIQGNTYSQYGAHVDDSTNFQVYNNTQVHENTTRAVQDTYGKMLFYEGNPAEVFYYSTSCGRGADGAVWGSQGAGLPYLRAMEIRQGGKNLTGDNESESDFDAFIRKKDVSAWDSSFPMFRWETDIPAELLTEQIEETGKVKELAVTERGSGGIAAELQVAGSSDTVRIKGQNAIRAALGNKSLQIRKMDGSVMEGSSMLPSAFISIEKREKEDGSIVFHVYGGGFGHGVGMSQNAAQAMAKSALSYEEILDFFYHGAELK